MDPRFQQHRARIRGRIAAPALLAGLAAMLGTGLRAQGTNCVFSQGGGQSSTFAVLDPAGPVLDPLPITAASSASPGPGVQPWLPTIPLDQYQAIKAASAQHMQTSFASPPDIQSSSPVPRAPATPGPLSSTPAYSWQGIQDTAIEPPNPSIAVGPSDVVMVVNSTIAQFTRAGLIQKLTTFQDWFAPLSGIICPSGAQQCVFSDPTVRYDQIHGRFLFLDTIRDFQARTSYLLLSVSNGATFAGGWKIWALDARFDGSNPTSNWGDFWRFSVDNAAVYLAGDMFSQGQVFQYGKIRILKKSELYNPAATTVTYQDFYGLQNADGTAASSILPVQQRGRPSGTNAALLVNAATHTPASYLTVWQIDNPLAVPPVAHCSTVSGLWPYQFPGVAPQLGGPGVLDTNDTSVLSAIYRDGFLYTARNTGYPDQPTTVTFDLIDSSTMKLSSQSRLVNTNSFYPAFDVPASVGPGVPFTTPAVGTTTAPDGSLTYAGISNLKAGEGYYSSGSSFSRWGDYSWGAIDPLAGGMWAAGEYAKPPLSNFGQWGTWAGYFPWTTSQSFSDVPSTSPYFDYINVMKLWQITGGCSATPALYCPGDPVTRAQMAVFVIRSIAGDAFPYTTTPYFTDVPASDPYFPYIQKLRDLGITLGCTASSFCPGNAVTRGDVAVLIVRGKLKGLYGDTFPYPSTAFFSDVPAASPYFPYIQKMSELGMTAGCAPGRYCPGNPVTRQEVAVFVTRAFLN